MLPSQINLKGCMHNVAEHEGLIVFTPRDRCWGTGHSITFERVELCWYVSLESSRPDKMVSLSFILKAWEHVEREYGGKNFAIKEPTHDR